MLRDLQLPDSIGIAEASVRIESMHSVACIYSNGSMVGTITTANGFFYLDVIGNDDIPLSAVFTSIEKVLSFLIIRKGNYLNLS